ncbi:MAG TPA: signal peptidase I [Dehalococcoidales bacterium]|nr:signal peptidase I [Dehalococcoidales bacterium]
MFNIRTGAGGKLWLCLGLVIGVYLAINLGLPLLPVSGMVTSYVFQPLLWLAPGLAVLASPPSRPAGKISARTETIQLGLLIGFLQVVFYVIGGLFSGFGKSPSAFTPLSILMNLFLVSSMLAGMETSRAWLINNLGGRHGHTILGLAVITLLYTMLSITLAQITGLKPTTESLSFINSTFIPTLAENLLASMLALSAGPKASLAYRGILQAFWWFCPILPDLSWAFKGIIGTAVPIVGLALVQSLYPLPVKHGKAARVKRAGEESPTGWVITTVFSVVIIWFAVGLFPVHPAVVGSGSMEPVMYTGDVVLIAKLPAEKIKVGDIIEFRKEEKIKVLHRVIEIRVEEGATKRFITKGDNNNDADSDPVIPQNVIGKIVFNVPKIGWLAIIVKGFFTG